MIPVTLVFHNPAAGQEAMVHFMKNVAIMAGSSCCGRPARAP